MTLLEKGKSIDIENYDLIDFNINNLFIHYSAYKVPFKRILEPSQKTFQSQYPFQKYPISFDLE
jgi:hypothetical protein